MKNYLLFTLLVIIHAPNSIGQLYNNGPISNSSATGFGGADESVLYTTAFGMGTIGFGQQALSYNRIADDFTMNCSWTIDSIYLYGYQSGSTTVSTFTSYNLRIWNGVPDAAGSIIVFGDTITNRLIRSVFSNVYRVTETTIGSVSRPIMQNTISVGITLPAGTYYLDWSAQGSLASGPWQPPVVITSQNVSGNGLQRLTNNVWNNMVDGGTGAAAQGAPFSLWGTAASTSGDQVVTNVACFGGNTGAINLTPNGGIGPYTYDWGGGITTEDRTNLTAGIYNCTVTDLNGCSGTVNATITEPSPLELTPVSQTNISCNGGSNGAASVNTATGGAGGYTYNWTQGDPIGDGTTSITGLSAGTWTCTTTDANGCTTATNFTITEPAALISAASGQTNVTCFGGNDGSATVSASGGTGNYVYTWSPSGGTSAAASALSAGSYSVTVADENGCSSSVSYSISQNSEIQLQLAQLTNVSCFNGNDGELSIQSSGGTGGYSYLWSNPNATSNTINALTAGTYQLTVTDNSLCSVSGLFIITQPALLTVGILPSLSIVCFGQSDATAEATASGGTSGYDYFWSTGTANTNIVTNIGAGTYSVQVTDLNGCTANDTITINSYPTPQVEAGANINQCGNQQVTLTASGANFYTWNNGIQNNTPFTPNYGTTSYIVTGTDNLGCSATDTVYVAANQIPDATISLANNIQLLASPANANYQWIDCNTITSILGANNSLYEAVENGLFAVIVTSLDGCIDTSNCFAVDQVGLDDSYSLLNIEMYPNPAHQLVTLSFNLNETIDLTFFNAQGQIVQSIANVNSGESIAIDQLAKGMYVIQINTSFGKELKRLIIE